MARYGLLQVPVPVPPDGAALCARPLQALSHPFEQGFKEPVAVVEQHCLLRHVQIKGMELLGLGPGADHLDEIDVDALHPEIFELHKPTLIPAFLRLFPNKNPVSRYYYYYRMGIQHISLHP